MVAKRCWTLTLVATLGFAPAAEAQEAEPPPQAGMERMDGPVGLQLALSAGVGAGLGYVYKNGVSRTTGQPEDVKVTDGSSVTLPVLLEVGYRASPKCYIGVWGSYEKVFTKTSDITCPEGSDCSVWMWRLGPEVRYHFSPGAGFDPWVGLGVGLEILRNDVESETTITVPDVGPVPARVEASTTDRGPTFARLSFGGDVRISRSFFLGPILTASIGSYTVHTGELRVTPPGLPSVTIQEPPVDDGVHALFTLGLRVAWLPL
ncbi:hypothetical protein ACLESO_41455 [Pyxidicoccus sp. 3LG]